MEPEKKYEIMEICYGLGRHFFLENCKVMKLKGIEVDRQQSANNISFFFFGRKKISKVDKL